MVTTLVGEAKKRIRKQGPCLMCGQIPYAAHRLIDAQMGRVVGGEPIEDVADDYETTVPKMVAGWVALMELLANKARGKNGRR